MTASDKSLTEELLRLHDWLTTATSNGPVAVITGKNGDMDTIGSAVALAASHPNLMAAGLHVGRVAQRMIHRHNAPYRVLKSTNTGWPTHNWQALSSSMLLHTARTGLVFAGCTPVYYRPSLHRWMGAQR